MISTTTIYIDTRLRIALMPIELVLPLYQPALNLTGFIYGYANRSNILKNNIRPHLKPLVNISNSFLLSQILTLPVNIISS